MSAPTAQTTPPRSRAGSDLSGNPGPRRFNNGWTKQQEELMAEWSDKAGCYRWLHDRCEKKYNVKNMWITIPVIILSTLTGTANFAIDGFVPENNPDVKKYIQAGIGGVSIFAGILTTLGNFLRFAQGSESHRVAGIAWGKFQRQIAVELAIAPKDRLDCMDFLKICRAELDRLIEQSPPIPDDVISQFKKEFRDKKDVKKPEICDGMEHTNVFKDRDVQLRMITSEAALNLLHKKKMLREEIVPDLNKLISAAVTTKINDLSGAVMEIYKRKEDEITYNNPLHQYKNTLEGFTKGVTRISGHQDGNWKRVNRRASVEDRAQTVDNATSDIHIDIVGSSTLDNMERANTVA
jgi:hypothetical protein